MSPKLLPLLVIGAVGGGLAYAESISLAPVADTTLFAFSPNNNLGAEKQLILGSVAKNAPDNRARMLVRFDLLGIPTQAVITNVSFQLTVLKENSGQPAEVVGLHRLLASWIEGDQAGKQGAGAVTGQPTWNSRAHNQITWGTPGGQPEVDFSAAAIATQNLDGPGRYTFDVSPALIAEVQAWLAKPDTNHGWLIKGENEAVGQSARRVGSRENSGNAPRLNIGYFVPTFVPQIVNFDAVQVTDGNIDLRFRALGGNIYSVWYRERLQSPDWITLTNVISKLVDADASVVDVSVDGHRFYQLAITGQVD